MRTITVQIGNSDDKLNQKEWANFVTDVAARIKEFCEEIHFFATSHGDAAWQNAAWVFTSFEEHTAPLKIELRKLAMAYQQDSIAYTEGETEFLNP